jgi:hypothetical protein
LFKRKISAATERRREKRSSLKKTRSWRVRWKSVRTGCHGHHFPNLPGGEITIEGSSFVKHCTTATKKSSRIKMDEKKRGESIVQK